MVSFPPAPVIQSDATFARESVIAGGTGDIIVGQRQIRDLRRRKNAIRQLEILDARYVVIAVRSVDAIVHQFRNSPPKRRRFSRS